VVWATGRRRVPTAGGAFLAVATAVLAVLLPVAALPGSPAAAGTSSAGTSSAGTSASGGTSAGGGGGRLPSGTGEAVCGDVRVEKSRLPGRRVTADNGDWPTAAAADLMQLHGWPRAVPFDVAHWTVVTSGDAGLLVASLPGSGFHYLPIHRKPGGGWSVGPPCVPR
jgi:hypothetical protein